MRIKTPRTWLTEKSIKYIEVGILKTIKDIKVTHKIWSTA